MVFWNIFLELGSASSKSCVCFFLTSLSHFFFPHLQVPSYGLGLCCRLEAHCNLNQSVGSLWCKALFLCRKTNWNIKWSNPKWDCAILQKQRTERGKGGTVSKVILPISFHLHNFWSKQKVERVEKECCFQNFVSRSLQDAAALFELPLNSILKYRLKQMVKLSPDYWKLSSKHKFTFHYTRWLGFYCPFKDSVSSLKRYKEKAHLMACLKCSV